MSRKRPLGAEDGTVLAGCSTCGNTYRFPTELRYCSDGLFRCNVFCRETENWTDYNRKMMAARQTHDEVAPSFPVGPKPGVYE